MKCFTLFSITVAFLFSALPTQAQVKLASQARLDLTGDAAVGALNNGVFLVGSGSADRMNWRPATEQPRTYTVNFPVVRFAWNEFQFQFVPEKSGRVTLSLMGPWEQITPGSGGIYRQEILWDAFSATGTTLSNGSFEQGTTGAATGWSGGSIQTSYAWAAPVDGLRMLRTWHDGSSTRTLTVTGGQPVTLRFMARTYVPPDYEDMKRITDTNSPAHIAMRKLMRGANFGNYLEAPPNTWGTIVYTLADLQAMKSEGFDHVRIPIGWHYYAGAGPQFKLAQSIFDKVDFLVTNALNVGLSAMINIHHFDEFTSDPATHSAKFYAIWEQIAERYKNHGSGLVFELLNEPKDAATTTALNPIYTEAIRRIRVTNPNRTIIVGPGLFNSINELPSLKLPDTDSNIVVSVHSYEPFYFTHQGATWAGNDPQRLRNIVFPGPPSSPLVPPSGISSGASNWVHNYNTQPTERNPSSAYAFRDRLEMAQQWSEYYGRPVHVGEFGAYELADPQSRVNFHRAMRETLDALGLGWAIWDWKAGFHYYKNNRPDPAGMRDALFPAAKLRGAAPGRVEIESSIGKTHVLHRATSFRPPISWSPVATQTVIQPISVLVDASANTNASALYRTEWIK